MTLLLKKFNHSRSFNMKKIYLTLFAMLLSFNAKAFVISPHVGLDYVSTTPNGFGHFNNLNGASLSAGVKALGFLSVEAFYQKYKSQNAQNDTNTKPENYGIDLVADSLNLGIVEVLTSVGYSKYTLNGGNISNKMEKFEGTAYRLGFGGQININDNLGVRAMYRYAFPDSNFLKKNVQELTIGLRYYFF